MQQQYNKEPRHENIHKLMSFSVTWNNGDADHDDGDYHSLSILSALTLAFYKHDHDHFNS